MTFTSCRVSKDDNGIQHKITEQDDYMSVAGKSIIKIQYSGVNYKDALGATGAGPIYKSLPINAGIDCAGVIAETSHDSIAIGDTVLVNGCGLGEAQDGGLAEYVQVPNDWLIPMPSNLSSRTAMLYGTAGFTAALALDRMLQNDQSPDMGPILVSGASGGVGSFAITMLNKLGFDSVAITGREEHYDYLYKLGANKVCSFDALDLGSAPLEKARFGGMIDNVGGEILSRCIPHISLWGNVSSIGMAAGHKLSSTVFPFILRGVSLLGASSTNCPMPRRQRIWQWIADELLTDKIELILEKEVPLAEVSPCFDEILGRKHRGRVIVKCD